jgi:hypothetical protein
MIDWRETPVTEDRMLANDAEELRAFTQKRSRRPMPTPMSDTCPNQALSPRR